MVRVQVEAFSGLRNFAVDLRRGEGVEECLDEIYSRLPSSVAENVYVTLKSGKPFVGSRLPSDGTVFVCLAGRLRGGKGGLSSQLRAQGGRMAHKRRRRPTESDKDQFRTLDGQRVGTVRRARDLAKAMQAKSELEKQAKDKKKAKLQAIVDAGQVRKKKFDDTEYLEQSEELVKSVRESTQSAAQVQASAESSSASPSSSSSSSSKPKAMDFFDEEYSAGSSSDEE